MDEPLTTAEAAERLGVSARWLTKLCEQKRVQGAYKFGRQWVIPAGAKIAPTGLGRPLRTLEIPKSKGGKR